MRRLCLLAAALTLSAQDVGRLLYVTGPGRGVTLVVQDGGHKAFVTLRPEAGQAAEVRRFVLTHAGPEKVVAPGAKLLFEHASAAWRVREKADRRMLKTPEATYWSYTPGLVLPVRFQVGKDQWRLLSADLPPRMFISSPESP